jgi:hypothetical protein
VGWGEMLGERGEGKEIRRAANGGKKKFRASFFVVCFFLF